MSRTLRLLVVLLFAASVVGCGSDKGDDATSQNSSNEGGGSGGSSDDDMYGGSDGSDSGADDDMYGGSDGSDSGGDDDFYKDGDGGSSDDDFYKDGDSGSSDDDFYKDGDSGSSDDDFYKDGDGGSSDDDFYKDGDGGSSDDDFYKDGDSGSSDDDFYKDGDSGSSDDDFYKDGDGGSSDDGGGSSDDDFYKDSGSSTPDAGSGDSDFYGDSSDGPRRAKPAPKTYSDHARVSFEQGHDDLALKYSYAAILTDADAAAKQVLHYWAGPKKPTMAIRWGVGINYMAPKNLKSRPPMIGDKPNIPERGQEGNGRSRVIGRRNRDDNNFGDSGDSGYDSGDDYGGDGTGAGDGSGGGSFRLPKDSWGQVSYLTGDVGERFIERLDMRRGRSYYGAVLKDAPKVQRKSSSGDFGGDGYSDGGSGTADYSDGGSGVEDYSDDSSGGGGGGSFGQTGPQLIPGVTMLGLGNSKELLARAEQQNLDVVLVFDVTYAKLRNGIEKNDTVMRLYFVAGGKELRKATLLNNLAVWNAREDLKNEKDDPVDLAIDDILSEFADEHVHVGDLPQLDSERAKIRVSTLTESKVADPLPVLVEIKYFHTKGWLTDSELADAYKALLGEDAGLQLASGSLEEQKKALSAYLESAADSSFSPSSPSKGGFR